MKILALRSIPLSKATRDGWHAAGVRFAKRKRNHEEIDRIVEKWGYTVVLNLGDSAYENDNVRVYNPIELVETTMDTSNLREALDGYGMPTLSNNGPHWHKHGGGWGGTSVTFHENSNECKWWPNEPGEHECQQHIDGTEYRVITVGDKVVQAMRKDNLEWNNGKHSFTFNWVGVGGINDLGIIPLLKEATPKLPHWGRAILGWDVIRSDSGAYIIEANSCPGVNEATAKRIVKVIENEV